MKTLSRVSFFKCDLDCSVPLFKVIVHVCLRSFALIAKQHSFIQNNRAKDLHFCRVIFVIIEGKFEFLSKLSKVCLSVNCARERLVQMPWDCIVL